MIINVKNKEDKDILEDALWMIGFDVYNKIQVKITKAVDYHSVYNHIFKTILKLSDTHLFNQDIYLYSPLAPSNNHYLQQSRWGNPFTPKKTKDYQNNISKHLDSIDKWIIPHSNKYINTDFSFFFQRDNRDANNYFKVILDICEDILYENDKRTIPITNNVFISGSTERQLMHLSMSDKVGVFDDLNQLQVFIKSNCIECRKGNYKRRCLQFYNLLENRLPDGCMDYMECRYKTIIK